MPLLVCKTKFHPFFSICGINSFQKDGWKYILLIFILYRVILPAPAEQEVFMAKQKHMDLKERYIIEHSLDDGLSFKAIGKELGKDCTTISKEVRGHKVFEKKGAYGKAFNDCVNRRHCYAVRICPDCNRPQNARCCYCGKCSPVCENYRKEECCRLKKPPYVCNGCSDRNNCTLEKRFYRALYAQKEYEELRTQSRSGYNISESELARLDAVVSPLLFKGQSIHHIASNHMDEVMCSEKTLYNYVNDGLLSARNIDLPRKVRLHPRKGKKNEVKVDKACRTGRTFSDFQRFRAEHPELPVIELDTVEGIKGGACLLTIHFTVPRLQLAFKREANDSQSVIDIFEKLYLELRPDVFMNVFPILLADNGSEFSNPKAIEFDRQGNRRTYLFYCDASAPYQKGACENNHELIRRIIPKGRDISIFSEDQIRLMMSHINSYGRGELGNKSPFEMFSFLYGREILDKLGLKEISRDEITLTPALLK